MIYCCKCGRCDSEDYGISYGDLERNVEELHFDGPPFKRVISLLGQSD